MNVTMQKETPGDRDLTIQVQTSRGTDTFTFPKVSKVSDVIGAVIAHFGLPPADSYSLLRAKTNEVLAPERPLVSFHIEDDEVLILSSIGSGV